MARCRPVGPQPDLAAPLHMHLALRLCLPLPFGWIILSAPSRPFVAKRNKSFLFPLCRLQSRSLRCHARFPSARGQPHTPTPLPETKVVLAMARRRSRSTTPCHACVLVCEMGGSAFVESTISAARADWNPERRLFASLLRQPPYQWTGCCPKSARSPNFPSRGQATAAGAHCAFASGGEGARSRLESLQVGMPSGNRVSKESVARILGVTPSPFVRTRLEGAQPC